MRCRYFANVHSMLRSALYFAVLEEESVIDAYLASTGVWGDEDKLDDDGRDAVNEAKARIRDWKRWLVTHNAGSDDSNDRNTTA